MRDKDTNGFNASVESLLKGMEGFVSSKTSEHLQSGSEYTQR